MLNFTSRRLANATALWCMSATLFACAAASGLAQVRPPASPTRQQRQPTAHRAEGVAAFERGDDAAAREHLRRAVAADPRDGEAHTYLGVIADRAGDLAEAEQHFAAAARLAPRSAAARNNYGALLIRLDRPAEAAAQLEASLRLDPNQANALVNLARIRFDENTAAGLGRAEQLFRRAEALAPDAEIARALTVIALRRNDAAGAAEYYRAYASRLANASGQLPAAARAQLGGALFEAKLLTEAENELKAALALDAANTDATVNLARVYLARKDVAGAGRTLESAVARKIESAAIYSLLAKVYEQSGHIENAIPAMRLAIELEPQSEKYRLQYGLLLTNTDAPSAALIRLNEALQSFPNSTRIWLGIGIANLKLNRNEEATRAFDQVVKIDPKLAHAYACLGIARAMLGQYDESVAQYERALRIDPKLGILHYLIADALSKKPDVDHARVEANLRKLIATDADHAPSRVALGKALARTDRFAEAAAELERAVKLAPDSIEAYYQLGRVYARLRRQDEAREAMAKFKTLSDTQKKTDERERHEIVRRLTDVLF